MRQSWSMTPERINKLRRILALRQPDLTLLAERVYKTHNFSAILRSCDAVGMFAAHAVAPHGTVRRYHMIAGGVNRWINVTLHDDTRQAYQALRAQGWRLIAAHHGPQAIDYRDVDYTGQVAIVVGMERDGLSDHAVNDADVRVSVPMRGMAQSLNVSVATALVLFEAARQREAAGLYERSRLTAAEAASTLFEWAYPHVARRCRRLGRAYPVLREDGSMAVNPLTQQPAPQPVVTGDTDQR